MKMNILSLLYLSTLLFSCQKEETNPDVFPLGYTYQSTLYNEHKVFVINSSTTATEIQPAGSFSDYQAKVLDGLQETELFILLFNKVSLTSNTSASFSNSLAGSEHLGLSADASYTTNNDLLTFEFHALPEDMTIQMVKGTAGGNKLSQMLLCSSYAKGTTGGSFDYPIVEAKLTGNIGYTSAISELIAANNLAIGDTLAIAYARYEFEED